MAAKQKILIVDDDENIAELISLYLTKECFDTKRYCISDYRCCFSGGDTILLQETEGFEKGQIMQYL